MHIPDNYLSPSTCAVMAAAVIPAWTISVKKLHYELPKEKIVTLGTLAAFSFLGMMFNIPIPGGTTGHAVGAVLIACLLGPYASCIAVSVALLIQALLFGDGGILAFGANCFNMAFIMPFTGYYIYSFLSKNKNIFKNDLVNVGIAGYIGLNAAALCAAIEFGIQPLLFTDAAGNAIYCPYSLSLSIPAMMIGHLTIFGLAEIIYTVCVFGFIKKTTPDIISVHQAVLPNNASHESSDATPVYTSSGTNSDKKSGFISKNKYILALISLLIILTPLGLIATGTAWGEWGSDEVASVTSNGSKLGYVPSKIADGFSLNTLIPDYAISGIPEWAAYILSAIIGTALLIIIFKLTSLTGRKKETLFNEY